MKIVSVVNQPGGVSRIDEETRIVGFRVACSEIESVKGASYFVTNTDVIEDLAVQYLKDNGYEVTKK